jgi:mannonate dehydratase
MDRRNFGKTLLGGVAGAGALAASGNYPAQAQAQAVQGRVLPDLKVIRNDKIRPGGDYHSVAGETFTSKASLEYFARFGATHLTCISRDGIGERSLPAEGRLGGFLDPIGPWSLDALKRMQDDCQKAGLVLEGVRMDSAYIIMKPGPERDRYLDVIRANIRKAGQAGVSVVSYHWTAIPIRRNRKAPGRGGSTYEGFKLEPNYKDLPPTAAAGRVSAEEYWSRIDYFLKAIVPAAREAKVKLACHPYDPGGLPLGYQGVDNWTAVDYVAALKKYEMMYDDPYNGFTYDCGVAGESLPDPNSQLGILRELSERGKIAQVHFRNVRGHQNDFLEVFHDEGDVNMLNVIRVLRDTNWAGTLLPDHAPAHPDDPKKLQAFAFAYGYIAGLLRAAKEEALRLT